MSAGRKPPNEFLLLELLGQAWQESKSTVFFALLCFGMFAALLFAFCCF